MFSRLPRGLIDSYAMRAASSSVELLCRDVEESQDLAFKKCDSINKRFIPHIDEMSKVFQTDSEKDGCYEAMLGKLPLLY